MNATESYNLVTSCSRFAKSICSPIVTLRNCEFSNSEKFKDLPLWIKEVLSALSIAKMRIRIFKINEDFFGKSKFEVIENVICE